MPLHFKKAFALRDNKIQEVDDNEVDVELLSPNNFFSTHINLIPMHSAVQGPRLFYGARFYNQALPLAKPDAPLVQNLDVQDKDGQSFDEKLGKIAGAVIADDDGEVVDLTPDFVKVKKADGSIKSFDLYNNFPFNRKSVTGTSTILIKRNGDIQKYSIEDYIFEKGDLVLSYSVENKKSAWQEVTAYLKHANDKKLYTVAFESGRTVTVTEDHSLLTLDKNCNIVPVYPLDCVVNRTKSPVAFGNVELAGDNKDRDLGTLVGLYLAEGSLGKQKGLVSIAVQDNTRVSEVKELVIRTLGVKPHDSKVNCSFTSHEFQKFLRVNCGSGSSNKFISNVIFNKSRAYLEGLICGYMAGDGCLWADSNGALQLTAVTVSKRLRDDLVDVLNILGVFTTLFSAPRNYINDKWNDGYGFRIISCHANKLECWFFYNDRHIKFNSIVKNKYRASPFEHIPLVPEAKKNLYKSFMTKVPHFVYKSALNGAVSKHRMKDAKGSFGLMANSDLLWDKIISITPAPHEAFVYDLEVNSSEAFAVNGGLLVHNTAITHKPLINKCDVVKKGQLLAKSNYTSDSGALALGANAKVGLVPFKGYSMDDAIVISNSFAKRLTSDHSYTIEQDYDNDVKGGLNHYVSLFPTQFTKDQIKKFDANGVVKPGTVVKQGDPLILATRPRVFSSTTAQLGKLSKAMRQSRHDSSQVWDSEFDGVVTDVAKTKTGYKVIVKSEAPAQMGDKIVFRSGQKGVIANILSDDHMPRTKDGEALEVLLNPLGIPSRVNNGIIYELLLGKAAAKLGKPIKVPSFNKPSERWYDFVAKTLQDAGLSETEEVFDPMSNRLLENPITVGVGHILKLHHTSASKASARGQGGYDCYDAETEVLTDKGWTPWPLVSEEDRFFTVLDGQATYRRADKIVSYDFDGELLGFESKYLNWLTTPNHNHLVKLKKNWKKISAEELASKSRFHVKQFGFGQLPGTSPDHIEIAPPEFKQVKKRRKVYKNTHIAIDDYATLVGWWLSEGSVVFNEKHNKYRTYIWQHEEANPVKSAQIRELLKRLPYKWNMHFNVEGKLVGYWIDDAGLAQHFMQNYGKLCGNKRLWRNVFSWAPEHRQLLLSTAMLGDGSQYTHANSKTRLKPNIISNYTTTSEALADDIQELAIGLGFGALIGRQEGRVNNKGYMCKASYTVGLHYTRKTATGCTRARYEGKHVRVPYTGKVYCATIPESGLLYVRRNKKPVLSGNSDQQPLKGGSEAAQAKRLSGLEVHSLLSAGAYKTLKEGATLRGQKNDEYWRALRQGYKPKPPGAPFAWEKFQTLLTGAGLQARKIDGGKLRLGPFTDDDLDKRGAVEIKSGDLVDLNTMDPVAGGLFDQAVVGNNKWGKISLPFKVPNPAFEPAIRHLLGLTEKELRGIMSGQMELPDHLR